MIETPRSNKIDPKRALSIVSDKTFLNPVEVLEITEDQPGSEYRGRPLPLYKIEALSEEDEKINVYLILLRKDSSYKIKSVENLGLYVGYTHHGLE